MFLRVDVFTRARKIKTKILLRSKVPVRKYHGHGVLCSDPRRLREAPRGSDGSTRAAGGCSHHLGFGARAGEPAGKGLIRASHTQPHQNPFPLAVVKDG